MPINRLIEVLKNGTDPGEKLLHELRKLRDDATAQSIASQDDELSKMWLMVSLFIDQCQLDCRMHLRKVDQSCVSH